MGTKAISVVEAFQRLLEIHSMIARAMQSGAFNGEQASALAAAFDQRDVDHAEFQRLLYDYLNGLVVEDTIHK